MDDLDTRLVFRSGRRSTDFPRFLRAAIGRPGSVLYSMDLASVSALSGTAGSWRSSLVVDTGDAPAAFLSLVSAGRARVLAARLMESVAYRAADLVVVRGPHHQAQLHDRGVDRVVVIPDGVDLGVFDAVEDGDLRRSLGLERAFTVGIQANFTWFPALGGGVGWELVHAMAQRPDLPIRAVLIGDGPGLGSLRALARELGVADRVHEVGRVPYAELPRYLGVCDTCLLTQTNDPSSWVRTTGKLPGYLAAGRYVLASRVGTAASLLPEEMLLDYSGHWDLEYPRRLAERLATVIDDPRRAEKGLALRSLAKSFDYDLIARQAAQAVRDVGAEHDAGRRRRRRSV